MYGSLLSRSSKNLSGFGSDFGALIKNCSACTSNQEIPCQRRNFAAQLAEHGAHELTAPLFPVPVALAESSTSDFAGAFADACGFRQQLDDLVRN